MASPFEAAICPGIRRQLGKFQSKSNSPSQDTRAFVGRGGRLRQRVLGVVLHGALTLGLAVSGQLVSVESARAQTEDELSEARVKFQHALELEQANDWAGALRLFRQVGQVKLTPQIRYHIAVCEENLGHLVEALGGYKLALSRSDGMHPDFVAEVQASVDELAARIPKLVIERGKGAEAATVEIDGIAIGDSQIGVEIPLNPGPHAVVAKAPGHERFQQTVEVRDGNVERLTVKLKVKKAPPPEIVTVQVPGEPQGFGKAPLVLGGVGLGLIVVSGVLAGVNQGLVAQVKELCGGDRDCTDADVPPEDAQLAEEKYNTAKALEVPFGITLGLGAAALATGAVMFIIDKKRLSKESTFRVLPAAPNAQAGLSFIHSF